MRAPRLGGFVLGAAAAFAVAACSRQPQPAAPAERDRDQATRQEVGDTRREPAAVQARTADRPRGDERRAAPREVTVPSGTVVSIRLRSGVSSASAVSGQRLEGELAAPLAAAGGVVAEVGTPAEATVQTAVPSGHLARPARLVVVLDSLQIGGDRVPVVTSAVERAGPSHKQRNTRFIGGGAAAGALIGQLLGHNRDATLRGAAVGAAAGTGAAAATGKLDVAFGAGEVLTFTLLQPLPLRR